MRGARIHLEEFGEVCSSTGRPTLSFFDGAFPVLAVAPDGQHVPRPSQLEALYQLEARERGRPSTAGHDIEPFANEREGQTRVSKSPRPWQDRKRDRGTCVFRATGIVLD